MNLIYQPQEQLSPSNEVANILPVAYIIIKAWELRPYQSNVEGTPTQISMLVSP